MYLTLAVIYPTIVLMTLRTGPDDVFFLWVSPFFGMFLPMGWVSWRMNSYTANNFVAMSVWVVLTSAVAYVLLWRTLRTFDRLLGRVPEFSKPHLRSPRQGSSPAKPIGTAARRDRSSLDGQIARDKSV